jgi:hypothetical protein
MKTHRLSFFDDRTDGLNILKVGKWLFNYNDIRVFIDQENSGFNGRSLITQQVVPYVFEMCIVTRSRFRLIHHGDIMCRVRR